MGYDKLWLSMMCILTVLNIDYWVNYHISLTIFR